MSEITKNNSDDFMMELSVAKYNEKEPNIQCNYYNVIGDLMVTIAQMQTKINELESRIYTLEGLVK